MPPLDDLSVVKTRPARRGVYVVAQLNERWRVIDDPLQWILQVRKGRATGKASGWKGMRFCQTRTALIRDIGELCGDVDPTEMAIIKTLPDLHYSCHRNRRPKAQVKAREVRQKDITRLSG